MFIEFILFFIVVFPIMLLVGSFMDRDDWFK